MHNYYHIIEVSSFNIYTYSTYLNCQFNYWESGPGDVSDSSSVRMHGHDHVTVRVHVDAA